MLGVVAGSLAGCSSSGGRSVTIYSGRTSDLIAPVLDRFAEESGISVDVRYGDSPDLALLIDQEGDRSPADVFLSQSPGAIGYIDSKDLLATLPASTLDKVSRRFRASDGDWVGVSGRVRVLAYNADTIDAARLPVSVYDVTDPKYRGRVGIAPTNASFVDFVSGMREATSDARTLNWLEAMKANDVQSYPNNIAILDAINRGEIDYGLVNHYYNEQAKAEDPGIATENHVFPGGDIGALILVTATGILKSSDNTSEAEELIDFLLSKQAQRFFADETFEYPLAAGVRPSVEDLPPLAEIMSPRLELSSLGDFFKTTRSLIQQAGLEGS